MKKKHHTPFLLRFTRWLFPKIEIMFPGLAVRYLERIFFTPLKYKTPDKEVEAEGLAVQSSIMVDNKRIQLYEWDSHSQPYVLVIHGWAGRATQFRKFIPVFNSAGLKVVGFDGPAHGKSSGKQTTIAEFEKVLNRIIEDKGVPEGIIAHSFGGGAALFAISHGLPVKKLINIASPTLADEIIKSFIQAINGSWNTGLKFKEFIHKKFGRPFEDFTALKVIEQIHDLELLLVHDSEDREVSLVQAQALKNKYPRTHLLITHGLGHNRILKDDAVIAACLGFIQNGRAV